MIPDPSPSANDFISKVTTVIAANCANELFGVSELADQMNMSRSNLLRKVKKLTKLSVSQLIRDVRLKRSMELLLTSGLNVTEVSNAVGFGSTSYFIKCFREHYGYPPGEAGKRSEDAGTTVAEAANPIITPPKSRKPYLIVAIAAILILSAGAALYYGLTSTSTKSSREKSIAVLPFKNDSNDSTNVYIINGLMESTLNNLQKIEDLKVISRTSSEKYRNTTRSIPEMGKELNVNYFVEGSGQKIGDRILLNIQLIDAVSDKHLWSKQYRTDSKDIFELQQEIAKNIAQEIQAVITPEEEQQIGKKPTEDLLAYDFYLKGRHLLFQGNHDGLEASLPYFKKAIEHDENFALAYAEAAVAYYYLDIFQVDKKYAAEIKFNSDKAFSIDPRLAESLIAKALYSMYNKEFELAVPYLEKAAEYNPNSALVVHFLSELYNIYAPNTAKYLNNAFKCVRMDLGTSDSATTSHNYMHLANALMQAGFLDEALTNVNRSLAYNPKHPFAGWVKIGIIYAKERNLQKTKQRFEDELKLDSTRFYIVQEIAKVCYNMRDYNEAYRYYKIFLSQTARQQLDIFNSESLKIGIVFKKMGKIKEGDAYVENFKKYVDNDRSIYRSLNLVGYYAYLGDKQKAIEQMQLFAKQDNFQYWVLLLDGDPVIDTIRALPEYKQAMQAIETKFWSDHRKIEAQLKEEGFL